MSGGRGSYADAANIPPSPMSAQPHYSQQYQQQPPQHSGGYHAMPPPLSNPPSFSSDSHSDPPSSYSSSLPRYGSGPSPLSPQGYSNQQQMQQQSGGPRPPPKSNSHPDPRLYPAHPLSNSYSYADSPTATLRGGESTDDLGKKGMSEKAPLTSALSYQNGRPDSGFKRISGAFVNGKKVPNDDQDPSAIGGQTPGMIRRKRLGYLDGLKFVAAMIVLNGTLFDAAVSNNAYTFIQRASPLYVLRDANLGIVALIMLSARSILEPLWDVPAPAAASQASSTEKKASTKEPTVAWWKVMRAMLTRPFRFILPVIVIAALQWGLRATNKTSNCNAVGMNEPYWNQITNFAGFSTLVFNMFTWFELDTAAGQAFGANLWFTPWLFQGSYCAYVAHIMLGNLSSNRYWVYFLLFAFSWFSFNFFAVAVVGVVLCDMAAHGEFARIHKLPFLVKLALTIAVIAIGCAIEFIGPVRSNLNSGMAVVNVTDHTEIQFADIIFVGCFLLGVEMSTPLQWLFGNVVMRLLGKLSAGLVLLAPAITFTIVPDLALSMSKSGSNGSAILGVTWVVLFLACFGLAIVFHFLVELPSKLAGEYFADFCQNWGRTDSTRAAIKEANARAKTAIKAPVNATGRLKKGGK